MKNKFLAIDCTACGNALQILHTNIPEEDWANETWLCDDCQEVVDAQLMKIGSLVLELAQAIRRGQGFEVLLPTRQGLKQCRVKKSLGEELV